MARIKLLDYRLATAFAALKPAVNIGKLAVLAWYRICFDVKSMQRGYKQTIVKLTLFATLILFLSCGTETSQIGNGPIQEFTEISDAINQGEPDGGGEGDGDGNDDGGNNNDNNDENTGIDTEPIVLYNFDEGSGDTVHDSSGVDPALDLKIQNLGNIAWGNGSLAINASTLIQSEGAASKVHSALTSSNELSIEALVEPGNLTQGGPARMVSLSANPLNRNFTLAQNGNHYDMRLRTTSTSTNGLPSVDSSANSLTTALQHVVYTFKSGEARIYIDGILDEEAALAGTFASWDPSYALYLANEGTGDRPWLGRMHKVAIYDRALTAAEVETLSASN